MVVKKEKKEEAELIPQEKKEYERGRALYEMDRNNPGWQYIKGWYEDFAHHTWIDPREIEGVDAKKEWEWRELNAFHAANNAKEILERIARDISQYEYLDKVKSGEIQRKKMKI